MEVDLEKDIDLQEKILEENRRVHALEGERYLERHPEQTNYFQTAILKKTLDRLSGELAKPVSNILDLGCGTGYLYLKLLAQGHRMTGVDLSREMIQGLKRKVPHAAKSRSSITVMPAEEFMEANETLYDAIVMSALLHHLYDYQSLVRQACRKLPPGGLLCIFFEPLKQEIYSSLRYILHKGIALLDETAYRVFMQIRGIPLFEGDYDLSDYQRRFGGIDPVPLKELLQAEGMQIMDEEKYCSRRYGFSAFIATSMLGTQNTFNMLAKKIGPAS